MMPIGWGDTYEQFLPGQAFDITNLPNGTYYIEIIANPGKVLHETNYRNDVSLRKIILGGTPAHRTVKVPAVHGIDPEHMGYRTRRLARELISSLRESIPGSTR
jgi:hypothetical protein